MSALRLLFTTGAALFAFAIIKRLIQGLFSPLARIPGPWHTRFTGFVCQWHRLRGTKMKWAHDLSLQYGSVVRISPVEVAAFDPALWEDINRMGSGFRKTAFHDQLRIGSDHMLFSIVDVKRHAKRRRLFARALTMDTIRRNWEAKIRTKVERAIKEIRSEADHTGTADVCKWWRLLAGDVIALMSFGESFDLVENGATMREGEGNAYFRALENAGINIVLSSLVPHLGFWAWLLPFQSLKDIASANDVVAEKGDVAVRNLKKKGLEKPNLFTNMLTEAAKAGEDGTAESLDLTDSVIRAEAAGFLLAGSDTTGTALTYMVWAVLNKPDLQRRMEDEMAKLPHDFTDKDLEGLPLLNNVLDEVLRLHSPAAGNILRKTPSQGVTWHGYFIPGGTSVMTQQYTMIRNPGLFPDPERFDETRFKHATEQQRRVAQPFGLGSRSCIGIPLAKLELRLATALFFRELRGARISKDMTDEMMVPVMKFFTFPASNRCNITFDEKLARPVPT